MGIFLHIDFKGESNLQFENQFVKCFEPMNI